MASPVLQGGLTNKEDVPPTLPAESQRKNTFPPLVHLMYGNGGGGHKASADAVKAALDMLPFPVKTELIDASAVAGAALGDSIYNFCLARGATPVVSILHAIAATFLPLVSPAMRSSFVRYWRPVRLPIHSRSSSFSLSSFSLLSTVTLPSPSVGAHGTSASVSSPNNMSSEVSAIVQKRQPDLVVSFVPQLNAVMADALQPLGIPLITVLTDFTHTTDHPWLQHTSQRVACGTPQAFAQCAKLLPAARRTQTSGMVVHPRFYETADASLHAESEARRTTRAALGLDPDRMTVLLLFGADPPTTLVKQLVRGYVEREDEGREEEPVNLIVVCGRNQRLRRDLIDDMVSSGGVSVRRNAENWAGAANVESSSVPGNQASVPKRPRSMHSGSSASISNTGELSARLANGVDITQKSSRSRMFVTGFTRNVPQLMRAADVLVGKPGPGVVSEAAVMRVPCVLMVGDGVMRQERDVVEWVLETGVGMAAESASDATSLSRMQVQEMQRCLDAQPQNTAVFEVAGLIADALGWDHLGVVAVGNRGPSTVEQRGYSAGGVASSANPGIAAQMTGADNVASAVDPSAKQNGIGVSRSGDEDTRSTSPTRVAETTMHLEAVSTSSSRGSSTQAGPAPGMSFGAGSTAVAGEVAGMVPAMEPLVVKIPAWVTGPGQGRRVEGS